MQRWYRQAIDLRKWLPQMAAKVQARREKRAATNIQRLVRGAFSRRRTTKRREAWARAAKKIQRSARDFLSRRRDRLVRERKARRRRDAERKEKEQQDAEAAHAREEQEVGDDLMAQMAAQMGAGGDEGMMPADDDPAGILRKEQDGADKLRKSVRFSENLVEDEEGVDPKSPKHTKKNARPTPTSPQAKKFQQELAKTPPHMIHQQSSRSIFHRFSPDKKQAPRKKLEAPGTPVPLMGKPNYGELSSSEDDAFGDDGEGEVEGGAPVPRNPRKHPRRRRYSMFHQHGKPPPVINATRPNERTRFTSRRGSVMVELLAHKAHRAATPGDGAVGGGAGAGGDGAGGDGAADGEESADLSMSMDALMRDAMEGVAAGGDEGMPPPTEEEMAALAAGVRVVDNANGRVLHRHDTHAVVVLAPNQGLRELPADALLRSARSALPAALRGFECEALMDFYLPAGVARKVHGARSALPREMSDVTQHSLSESIGSSGGYRGAAAAGATFDRVTCHTRIYVGRGLARFDVLVPPFGVFTVLAAGSDPEDVSGGGSGAGGGGLRYDQVRYIYLVRSLEIHDSDNPEAHRVFLTAGDLMGTEGGSAAARAREAKAVAEDAEDQDDDTDGMTTGSASPRSNMGDNPPPLSKTTRRIHAIAKYLAMTASRMSLATMCNVVSDCLNEATTPRESVLEDVQDASPAAGVFAGARRVRVKHHPSAVAPHRRARKKHPRRVSVFIDIDSDGVMDTKIIGDGSASAVGDAATAGMAKADATGSEEEHHFDAFAETEAEIAEAILASGGAAAAHIVAPRHRASSTQKRRRRKNATQDNGRTRHGSPIEIDFIANALVNPAAENNQVLVLAFSRAGLAHAATSAFTVTTPNTCAWHPPRKARAFVDIIVPLEVPPQAEALAKLCAPGGPRDPATQLSQAYWAPRLGIEWIVQVFTGTSWQYGKATRYKGNGMVVVEQVGSDVSTRSLSWDPTLHVCACHEQSMIEIDLHSGIAVLVRPLDHSTESVALFTEIYLQTATEEIVLAASEGALPPVLSGLGDYDFHSPPQDLPGEPVATTAAATSVSGDKAGLPGAAAAAAGAAAASKSMQDVATMPAHYDGDPNVSPDTIAVDWAGRLHLPGTYPRSIRITEYHPGAGLANAGRNGPRLRLPPGAGGLSDCSITASMDGSRHAKDLHRFRRQEDLLHESSQHITAEAEAALQEEYRDAETMEFYLDDFLNDGASGAMVELVQPINDDHSNLFHQLQRCYCTFFYEADDDSESQALRDARRQQEEQRRRAMEEMHEKARQEAEERKKLQAEQDAALERQKQEMRAVISHEREQYRLLREQGLVAELVGEDNGAELGTDGGAGMRASQRRHVKNMSSGSVFDDEMFAKNSPPTSPARGLASVAGDVPLPQKPFPGLKGSLGSAAEREGQQKGQEAEEEDGGDDLMAAAMAQMAAGGDQGVAPDDAPGGDTKTEDPAETKDDTATEPGERKEQPAKEYSDLLHYTAHPTNPEKEAGMPPGPGGDDERDDADDEDALTVRVLWELQVNDDEEEGGLGWTTVLVTRYRHDDTPHGTVYIVAGPAEEESAGAGIGWIPLEAHDCKLRAVCDEDSTELYQTVKEGLLLDRRNATVTKLAPIKEDDDDDEAEVEDAEGVTRVASRRESRGEGDPMPDADAFQPSDTNFDGDGAGAGASGSGTEASLTKAEKFAKLKAMKNAADDARMQQGQSKLDKLKRLQAEKRQLEAEAAQASGEHPGESKLDKLKRLKREAKEKAAKEGQEKLETLKQKKAEAAAEIAEEALEELDLEEEDLEEVEIPNAGPAQPESKLDKLKRLKAEATEKQKERQLEEKQDSTPVKKNPGNSGTMEVKRDDTPTPAKPKPESKLERLRRMKREKKQREAEAAANASAASSGGDMLEAVDFGEEDDEDMMGAGEGVVELGDEDVEDLLETEMA